jgi:uncharacterized coiled-coil DUF342 family protein
MKRALTWVNLMGVLLLAGLCVIQWQRDRHLHLEIQSLEKARHEHEQTIRDQERAAKGLTNDLDRFKVQFQTAHGELTEARAKAVKLERENLQLLTERDQLKASITNWAGAIAERDLRLQQVNEQIRDLSARLRESVLKFNELASNHHASIQRFNELATNYNQVVTQLNESRAAGSSK